MCGTFFILQIREDLAMTSFKLVLLQALLCVTLVGAIEQTKRWQFAKGKWTHWCASVCFGDQSHGSFFVPVAAHIGCELGKFFSQTCNFYQIWLWTLVLHETAVSGHTAFRFYKILFSRARQLCFFLQVYGRSARRWQDPQPIPIFMSKISDGQTMHKLTSKRVWNDGQTEWN